MDDSGFKDVDFGLTTRELAKMIRESGIHLPDMPKSDFDQPFVAVIVVRATGEVEVRSLLKSKSAINAALAAYYSENIKQAA